MAAGKVWTVLTYACLHDLSSLLHIHGNLLGWYWFGPQAERALGTRSYLRLTLVAVVLGGVLQLGWEALSGREVGVVGSSAAVMALLAHFAWSHPDARVLLFFVFPVRTQHLVPILLGLDALLSLTGSPVAVFAHAGGVLAAWYLVRAGGNPRVAWTRMKSQLNRLAGSKKTRRPNFTVLTGGRRDPFDNHPDRNRPDRWN
jgi:membrane associated rhomboid family serine protease